MIQITKIISGAQTGADLAALETAVMLGIPTGGWMPKGFKNETGPHPEFARLYKVQATDFDGYPARTELNVRDSDGTLRFAYDFGTTGERCTMRYIKKWGKPWFDFDLKLATDPPIRWQEVRHWLITNRIKTLNVAGNCASRRPGIQAVVRYHLLQILTPKQSVTGTRNSGKTENPLATGPAGY